MDSMVLQKMNENGNLDWNVFPFPVLITSYLSELLLTTFNEHIFSSLNILSQSFFLFNSFSSIIIDGTPPPPWDCDCDRNGEEANKYLPYNDKLLFLSI